MAATEGGADRLSALQDGPLQTVLSFLPSRDAVRTSVLARRWRDQWKFVPAVRITDFSSYRSAGHLNSFVNDFLNFRPPLPVSEMEINNYYGEDTPAAFMFMEQWIRYGLSNGAQVLHVCSNDTNERWPLFNGLLISERLIRSIVSRSVIRLSITNCRFNLSDRTRISFPSLTSFVLADCLDHTLVLESMPLLASAFVRLPTGLDFCYNKYETSGCQDVKCDGCFGSYTGNSTCVLEGWSAATSLELTSQQTELTFRDDLTCCPVFHKLKTLLLNEWCMTPNLDALCCFLQHALILQKLTFQFPTPDIDEYLVDNGGKYYMAREPLALGHLTVEVKCDEVDERISRILELLDCSGVPSEKIKILPAPKLVEFENSEGPWSSASGGLSPGA